MRRDRGWTCDLIGGLVQIVSVERDTADAVKAINPCLSGIA